VVVDARTVNGDVHHQATLLEVVVQVFLDLRSVCVHDVCAVSHAGDEALDGGGGRLALVPADDAPHAVQLHRHTRHLAACDGIQACVGEPCACVGTDGLLGAVDEAAENDPEMVVDIGARGDSQLRRGTAAKTNTREQQAQQNGSKQRGRRCAQ